jgi:hypothetical protein
MLITLRFIRTSQVERWEAQIINAVRRICRGKIIMNPKVTILLLILIKRIPRCSASGLIKIPFDTSQLCCGVVHCLDLKKEFFS